MHGLNSFLDSFPIFALGPSSLYDSLFNLSKSTLAYNLSSYVIWVLNWKFTNFPLYLVQIPSFKIFTF